MTAPAEVVIDRLVLHGVREADAPAVVAAFRRHLAELLRDPGAGRRERGDLAETERHGRMLAAAVARSVRRAGAT